MSNKIISFSLWGKDNKYIYGAVDNAFVAKEMYPDWKCRFYIDKTIPQFIIDELIGLETDIIVVGENDGWGGLFWRYFPIDDPDVDIVIFRDTDSRLDNKEVAAVNEWLKSGKTFHTIHDHQNHYDVPIMGGMWGFSKQNGIKLDIKNKIKLWQNSHKNQYYTDQYFLKDIVWSIAKDDIVTHSIRHNNYPSHLPNKYINYIGERCSEISSIPKDRHIVNNDICYIVTTDSSRHSGEVNAILTTWGKNVPLYFITDKSCNIKDDIFIKALNFDVKNGEERRLLYPFLHFAKTNYKWIFLCRDTTFVNTHKVEEYCKYLNQNDSKIYGHVNKGTFPQEKWLNYMSSGAGILMGNHSFKKLGDDMHIRLMHGSGFGDVTLGRHCSKCNLDLVHNNLFNVDIPDKLGIYNMEDYISFFFINSGGKLSLQKIIDRKDKKRALFVSHLGLGDHIMCAEMVDQISSYFDEIHIPVKPRNFESVKYLFSYLKNVVVFKINNDNISLSDMNKLIAEYQNRSFIVIKSGCYNSGFREGLTIPNVFYNQVKLSVLTRSSIAGKIKRDIGQEISFANTNFKDIIGKKYIFVHEKGSDGNTIDYGKIRSDLPILKPTIQPGNIFLYSYLLENATEIHCVDSSFAHVADILNLSKVERKCIHRYARREIMSRNSVIYIQNWELIYEDSKFNRFQNQ